MPQLPNHFIDIEPPNLRVFCWRTQDWRPEYAKLLDDNIIDGYRIGVPFDTDQQLSFLDTIDPAKLKVLEIMTSGYTVDLTRLERCTELRRLDLNCRYSRKTDFSKFTKLEAFVGDWNDAIPTLMNCENIQFLKLGRYPESDLRNFNFPNVQELQLLSRKLTSLRGIEKLTKLKEFVTFHGFKLASADDLAYCVDLRRLEIETCKRISNVDFIASLTKLEHLDLSKNGEIDSLKFVENCKDLVTLNFIADTIIRDNDVSPILSLSKLRILAFQNRKTYNYTCEKLRECLGINKLIVHGPPPVSRQEIVV